MFIIIILFLNQIIFYCLFLIFCYGLISYYSLLFTQFRKILPSNSTYKYYNLRRKPIVNILRLIKSNEIYLTYYQIRRWILEFPQKNLIFILTRTISLLLYRSTNNRYLYARQEKQLNEFIRGQWLIAFRERFREQAKWITNSFQILKTDSFSLIKW